MSARDLAKEYLEKVGGGPRSEAEQLLPLLIQELDERPRFTEGDAAAEARAAAWKRKLEEVTRERDRLHITLQRLYNSFLQTRAQQAKMRQAAFELLTELEE